MASFTYSEGCCSLFRTVPSIIKVSIQVELEEREAATIV